MNELVVRVSVCVQWSSVERCCAWQPCVSCGPSVHASLPACCCLSFTARWMDVWTCGGLDELPSWQANSRNGISATNATVPIRTLPYCHRTATVLPAACTAVPCAIRTSCRQTDAVRRHTAAERHSPLSHLTNAQQHSRRSALPHTEGTRPADNRTSHNKLTLQPCSPRACGGSTERTSRCPLLTHLSYYPSLSMTASWQRLCKQQQQLAALRTERLRCLTCR